MINAWHLVWIVPLSAILGGLTAALCFASKEDDSNDD